MVFLDELPADNGTSSSPRGPPGEASRLEGNKAYKDGDLASAVALYTQSLAEAPPPSTFAAATLGNRSTAYLALGRKNEALLDAMQSVGLSPAETPYAAKSRFRMGNALVAVGRLEDAREAYLRALSHAPGDKAILAKLAEASEAVQVEFDKERGGAATVTTAEGKEKTSSASKASSSSSHSNSSAPTSHSNSSALHVPAAAEVTVIHKEVTLNDANRAFREKRYAQALAMYNQVEAKLPPDRMHSFLGNRSAALLALGRSEDAVDDARMCVDLEPEYVKVRASKKSLRPHACVTLETQMSHTWHLTS
jgi:tetratricopeptide (TPR) repeat protein